MKRRLGLQHVSSGDGSPGPALLRALLTTTLSGFLLTGICGSATAQRCSAGGSQAAAAPVQVLERKLLDAPAPNMETDVPAALKPVLHDFKQALIEGVSTAMQCDAAGMTDPRQIQSGIASLLHANLPEKPEGRSYDPVRDDPRRSQTGIYGSGLAINVQRVPGQPDLLGIQISYGIECGADNILLVFRRAAAGWQRVLVWQNPDLNTVSDALGDVFAYLPVPAPQPAFVVVSGHPWCSSNLSTLRINLVALASPGAPQRELAHAEHDYRRDADTHFLPEADGFEIKATVDSIDGDLIMTPAILRYSTTGGRIEQQPVAANAQRFVDMYLMATWDQERRWSDPAHLAALKTFYDDRDADGNFTVHLGPVRACTDAASHFQVELPSEEEHVSSNLQITRSTTDSFYAQVQANPHSFTMLSIANKPDAACHGPDLMKK